MSRTRLGGVFKTGRALGAALLAVTGLITAQPVAAQEDMLRLVYQAIGEQTQVVVENRDLFAPHWGILTLGEASNMRADQELPMRFVLDPGERRNVLVMRRIVPTMKSSFRLALASGRGDPIRGHDDSVSYMLPFAHGTKQSVSQGYFGNVTHQGMHALDFELPEGTPIHAARAGIVQAVRDDATTGSLTDPAENGNYVQVGHSDGTWAIYGHLKQGGVAVRAGQQVAAGALLGRSGATGRASGPHLHFAVHAATWDASKTVPTRFQTSAAGEPESLSEGHTYYAYHPGGAAFAAVLGANLSEADLRKVGRAASGGEFRIREERIDRRVLIWAVNGTAETIDVGIDISDSALARASISLPYRGAIPARTELFLFSIDLLAGGNASYKLSTSYRRASPR